MNKTIANVTAATRHARRQSTAISNRNVRIAASAARYARFALLLLCALLLRPLYAQSDQWAVKMFSELGTDRMHNFGSVALHADVEKRFPFKNIYNEDVVISSVSSNCGCTKATVTKQVVHPGEIGEVVARVDTSGREHTKQRKATIRLVFSKPAYAEVQMQVKTYIRPDVGFEPGIIEFGAVQHGMTVSKKAYLQYEGRSDWALIGIQKNNPGIKAEAREVRRRGGSVVYEILVELKPDAAPGYIHDLLHFQTNDRDPATASIFLPVQALVVEPLSAKPSFLQLGVVTPGQKVTKNIVVSGSEPFKIEDLQSDDQRISYLKTNLNNTVHVLPISFTADDNLGEISATLIVTTDQVDELGVPQTVRIQTSGYVVAPGQKAPKPAARPTQPKSRSNIHGLGLPEELLDEDEGEPVTAPEARIEEEESADTPTLDPMTSNSIKRPSQTTKKNSDGWTLVEKSDRAALTNPRKTASNEWTGNWRAVRKETNESAPAFTARVFDETQKR